MPDMTREVEMWFGEPLARRAERCRQFLTHEGLLTEAEAGRVAVRMERAWDRLARIGEQAGTILDEKYP